jgi:hypothetical protein
VRIALAVPRRHSDAHLGRRTKRHWWRPFPTTQPTPTNQGAGPGGRDADGRWERWYEATSQPQKHHAPAERRVVGCFKPALAYFRGMMTRSDTSIVRCSPRHAPAAPSYQRQWTQRAAAALHRGHLARRVSGPLRWPRRGSQRRRPTEAAAVEFNADIQKLIAVQRFEIA